MAPRGELWQGRRVLVTGHTGFKGAWLMTWLEAMGAQVRGLSLAPDTVPSLHLLLGRDVAADIGDIRDDAFVLRQLSGFRPEVVFHLAAQPLVRRGYQEPVGTFDVNVMGTVRLLDAVRRIDSVRAVVVITSDKVYDERAEQRPYQEGSVLGGPDPYSASKGCAELVTSSYRRAYLEPLGVAVATVRAGNVVGGGDWSQDRLVPDVVRAWTQGEPIRLRFPEAVRPWQHVLDPLHGYLLTAEALLDGRMREHAALNFGPALASCRPVGEVVSGLAGQLPGGVRTEVADGEHPKEAALLTLSSALAEQVLGWRPVLDLDSTLSWTAEWYSAHHDGGDVVRLTQDQIRRFTEAA